MRPTILLVAATLVAGCASAEPESRSAPTPKTGADRSGVAAAGSGSGASEGVPSVARGLTVERALELADQHHPYMALARAEIEAHEGRLVQAGLLPSTAVIFRMESARIQGRTFDQAEYLAGVLQTIPISGRLGASERVEERDREHHLREAAAQRLDIHGRIRSAFATALYFERVRSIQATTAEQGERGLDVTRARVRAGDALPEDLARAEIEIARLRLEARRAAARSHQAIFDLTAAMGVPALEVESLVGSLELAFDLPGIEGLSKRLEEHPALLAALAKVTVEDARIDLAERLRLPDMYVDLYYRRLQHSNVDAFDAGFGFLLPFFDRSQGRIREAKANKAAAQAQVRSTQLELEAQLRSAHSRLVLALATARSLREDVLPKADLVLAGAEKRYKAGDASLADVLPVRRDRTAFELAHVEALREALEAWASLLPFVAQGGA